MKVDTSSIVLWDVFEIPAGLIDDVCEEFGIFFDESNVEEAIKTADLDNPRSVGSKIWDMFVDLLKDKLKKDYPDFDENEFDEISEYEEFGLLYHGDPFQTKEELKEAMKDAEDDKA